MNEVGKIDRALDEALVGLGAIVLRLADPAVTRTSAERHALVMSVREYARCAAKSTDPRVRILKEELEETIKPRLAFVSNN
jgi:hypothetical protein